MPKRARIAFIGAAVAVALMALTWYLAFHVGPAQRADQSILRGFSDLRSRSRIHSLAEFIAALCDPSPWIYFAVAVVALALLRGRIRVAFAVAGILLGANVTTQLLKPLLAEPRVVSLFGDHAPAAASWPSGHATAAMSLALCLILAVPSRLRPWTAALGAAFAVAVSYSFLTLAWHYPSDVFGGFLVASAWTLMGIGAVFTLDARRPRRIPSERVPRLSARAALTPSIAALAAATGAAGLVALARPHDVLSYVRAHELFTLGAAAIGFVALALATAVMLAARR